MPVPFNGRYIEKNSKAKYVWWSFELFNFGGNITTDTYCGQLN